MLASIQVISFKNRTGWKNTASREREGLDDF